MKLIALELSTRMGSVAFLENGEIKEEITWEEKFENRQQLFDALKKLDVDWNSIDTYVVGRGPGSFSGLRVGFSVVNSLAAPNKSNVYAHNSCVGFRKFFSDKEIIVVGDARRDQLWIGSLFNEKILIDFKLISYDDLSSYVSEKISLISPDQNRLKELLTPFQDKELQKSFYPKASEIGLVVYNNILNGLMCEKFEPLYMHPPVFIEPKYK